MFGETGTSVDFGFIKVLMCKRGMLAEHVRLPAY